MPGHSESLSEGRLNLRQISLEWKPSAYPLAKQLHCQSEDKIWATIIIVKPPRHIELVEGLGVFTSAHEVVGAGCEGCSVGIIPREKVVSRWRRWQLPPSEGRLFVDKQRMEAIVESAY